MDEELKSRIAHLQKLLDEKTAQLREVEEELRRVAKLDRTFDLLIPLAEAEHERVVRRAEKLVEAYAAKMELMALALSEVKEENRAMRYLLRF